MDFQIHAIDGGEHDFGFLFAKGPKSAPLGGGGFALGFFVSARAGAGGELLDQLVSFYGEIRHGGSFNAYIKEVNVLIDILEVLLALCCRYYNLSFIMSILNLNISRKIRLGSGIFQR